MKNKKGFTLAELLVVIVILGMISAIAVPSFSYIMKRWEIRYCDTQQRLLLDKVNSFYFHECTGQEYINDTKFFERSKFSYNGQTFTSSQHWLCGSFDPVINQWTDVYEGTASDSYVYSGSDGVDVICASAGEYMTRCMYEYNSDISAADAVFPTDEHGCQLYITYEKLDGVTQLEGEEYLPVGTITVHCTNPEHNGKTYQLVIK